MANGEGIRQLILGPVLCVGASLVLGAVWLLLPEQPYLVTAVSSSPSHLKKQKVHPSTHVIVFYSSISQSSSMYRLHLYT